MAFIESEIDSLNPATGPRSGGTTVVLTGQYFGDTITGVQFGSVAASSFTLDSDTQITAVSPAQESGDVSVGVIQYTGDVCGAATFTYI
jgi:hypothetical protein